MRGGAGGGGPVAGILVMTPFYGTGNAVSTMALATSVSVSEKAQKNLGEFTHPIVNTRLIQIMTPSSYGADVTTYAKAPTWDCNRFPQFYVYVTPRLETSMGPDAGSAS